MMDKLVLAAALVPSVLSCAISIFYAYIAYKKTKEPPKDEVWETATKIICSNGGDVYSDDFAELYTELKFFKENPELVQRYSTIRSAMKAKNEESASESKRPE